MSFREGNRGYEMWPHCFWLGVAAITYSPLAKTDLSKYPKGEPKKLWAQLEPSQKASLRRVAYEMNAGDVIYVKQGSKVVSRGIVKGPYQFDSNFLLRGSAGHPWAHQVPVKWESDLPKIAILLGAEQLTVKRLSADEIKRLETEIVKSEDKEDEFSVGGKTTKDALGEDAYYRESEAKRKIIIRRHNKLSNGFCKWLRTEHNVDPAQEQQQTDIQFNLKNQKVLAELKVCYGVGTTKSIREALGQLLEYNHYPSRTVSDVWMIVLDEEPSANDRKFIEILREHRKLPLYIGWRSESGFAFHPRLA